MAINGELKKRQANGNTGPRGDGILQEQIDRLSSEGPSAAKSAQTTANLLICVGGIYASLYGHIASFD